MEDAAEVVDVRTCGGGILVSFFPLAFNGPPVGMEGKEEFKKGRGSG